MLVGFSFTFLLCFRSKWTCRLSWLVCCLWEMWPLSLRRAMGLRRSVRPPRDGWRLQRWVTRNFDETLWELCSSPLAVWLQELFLPEDVFCLKMWKFLNNKVFLEVYSLTPWQHLCSLLFILREMRLSFCFLSYIVSIYLVDFIKHKLLKTKYFMIVNLMMPWRNSDVQYLYVSSVFSSDFVQGYHPKCCHFLLVILK